MTALTVAMPVYNGMPFLPAAVESILAQTFVNFDFLIVDDGSNDGSVKYLESLSDPRIQVHRQDRCGQTETRNRLLGLTKSKLCVLMDADDVSMPGRLQSQLEFMQEHPDVVLLGTQVVYIAAGRMIPRSPFPTTHAEIVMALAAARPVVCHPSCVFRTEAVRAVGGYRLLRGEEFDLFLRLSERGLLANLKTVLHGYRIHLGSTFATQYLEHSAHIAYAIICHQRRTAGYEEPPLPEFIQAWQKRSMLRNLLGRLDVWSALQFRRALLELGEGNSLGGGVRMAAAAFCRPQSTLRQIGSRLKVVLTGSSELRH